MSFPKPPPAPECRVHRTGTIGNRLPPHHKNRCAAIPRDGALWCHICGRLVMAVPAGPDFFDLIKKYMAGKGAVVPRALYEQAEKQPGQSPRVR